MFFTAHHTFWSTRTKQLTLKAQPGHASRESMRFCATWGVIQNQHTLSKVVYFVLASRRPTAPNTPGLRARLASQMELSKQGYMPYTYFPIRSTSILYALHLFLAHFAGLHVTSYGFVVAAFGSIFIQDGSNSYRSYKARHFCLTSPSTERHWD